MGTVVGLFESREKARRAVEALHDAGFRDEDMSLVMRDRREVSDVAADASRLEAAAGTGGGAAAGAVGGGMLGALAGLAVGLGVLTIPGIGPILAAGPIAAILAGGAIGVATGGILGSLVDLGVPEEEARHYQAGVERGGILLTVNAPDGREAEVRTILEAEGMHGLEHHRKQWEEDPGFRYDIHRSDDMRTHKTTDKVDEAKVDSKAAGTAIGGTAGAVIGGAVGGPVGAGIGAVVGSAVGGGAAAAMDYDSAEPEFRHEWERGPYKASSSWDEASSAYRYGWESYDRPEYHGRDWRDVSSHLKTGWKGKGNWSEYEPMIRSAWDRRAGHALQTEGEAVIPVVEEEVKIGKRQVKKGAVKVETHVTETPVAEQVHLHEEKVEVHRRPTNRPVTGEDLAAFQEGTIEVAETVEEAVVSKKPKVVEEVVIKKQARDRTETVHEKARRTDVEVKEVDTPAEVVDEGIVKEVKASAKKH